MAQLPPLRDILNDTPADAVDPEYNYNIIEAFLNGEVVHRDGSIAMTGPLTLSGAVTADAHAAPKSYVDALLPVGMLMDFMGKTLPAEYNGVWALCNGAEFSPTDPTYERLYAKLGPDGDDVLESGSGSNYKLPDFRKRVAVGKQSNTDGTFSPGDKLGKADGVAAHVHGQTAHTHDMTHNHAHAHGAGTLSATSTGSGHDHDPEHVEWQNRGDVGTGGTDIVLGQENTGTAGVEWTGVGIRQGNNGAHDHDVAGTTGSDSTASSKSETGNGAGASSPSTADTKSTGDASNGNYPPSLVVTKLIKL